MRDLCPRFTRNTHSAPSFPLCSLSPAIVDGTTEGSALFQRWNGMVVLQEVRSAGARDGWPAVAELKTHSFRSDAARPKTAAAGTFAQLLRGGRWHSAAYKLYLDLGHGHHPH